MGKSTDKEMITYKMVSPNADKDILDAFSELLPKDNHFTGENTLLFGAIDDQKQAVGAMAADISEDAYHINWLYVHPEMRRKGVATFLLQGMVDFIDQSQFYKDLEIVYSSDAWEVGEFLLSTGKFDIEQVHSEYIAKAESLIKSETIQRLMKGTAAVERYSSLDEGEKRKLLTHIMNEGYIQINDWEGFEKSLVDDLCVFKRQNAIINGSIFFRTAGEKELELFLFFSEDTVATQQILSYISTTIADKYAEYSIRLTPVNDSGKKLMEKISGEFQTINNMFLARWNYS